MRIKKADEWGLSCNFEGKNQKFCFYDCWFYVLKGA